MKRRVGELSNECAPLLGSGAQVARISVRRYFDPRQGIVTVPVACADL